MIKKFLLRVFNAVYHFIKNATEIVLTVFRSFHLSMRRKIAFDYLAIYVLIALISILVIPLIFMYYDISVDTKQIGPKFNQVLIAYNQGAISEQDLIFKVEQFSVADNISYYIRVYKDVSLTESIKDSSETLAINSGFFEEFGFPETFGKKINLLIKEKLVTKFAESISLQNEIQKQKDLQDMYVINAYFPLSDYQSGLLFLGIVLLIFYSVGFMFMLMVGGARIKQVLSPIFLMTKTAQQITISNMERRLDVENTKYELKDLAMTLNEMIDRLDKDYTKQKRFVSDVSHELRTPISIINGYASMLERWGKHDEEILEESITAIIGESKNMQILVENLLTLVRSDNQTLKYTVSSFDIGKLICDVVKEFNMVNTKNQYITCESSENLMVVMDEPKIKQTLRIFVDNAVKYTPDGGGIHVKCYELNNQIFIHIKDTGLGIAKEDLPHLFERFYRSDESRARETGGHGLGLAIAKVMVLGHNGKIQVKTRLAKGSEFIISLPKFLEVGVEEDENSTI